MTKDPRHPNLSMMSIFLRTFLAFLTACYSYIDLDRDADVQALLDLSVANSTLTP